MDRDLQALLQGIFGCAPDVALRIGAGARDRRYPVRAVILKQGDRAVATYLLAEGRAHALSYGPEGQSVLLQEFASGDFFGAVAAAEPASVDADVVAVEDSRALIFLALEFVALIETHACVGLAVSRALLKQLRATAGRMIARTTLSAAGRVHAELLRLARSGDGRTVKPIPVLSEMAVRVHATRETVSRAVAALERRGIVKREANALVIVASRRLEEMVI